MAARASNSAQVRRRVNRTLSSEASKENPEPDVLEPDRLDVLCGVAARAVPAGCGMSAGTLLGNVESFPGKGNEAVFEAFAFDGEAPDTHPGLDQVRNDFFRERGGWLH